MGLQRKAKALVLTLMLIYINSTISQPSQRDQENEIHSNDEEHNYRINYAKKILTYMNMSVDPCEDFYEFACGNWKNVIEKKLYTISQPSQRDQENEIHSNDEEHNYRINYAKKMLTYMNMSVDPCEDFYEFACGNWKNVIEEKHAQHKRSNLFDIEYKIEEHVYEILQKSSNNLDLNYKTEFEKAQKFYQSCASADLYTIQKSSEYLKVIKNIGGFPAVDDSWNPDEYSWFNMSAHLTNYGAFGLINELIINEYPFPPHFTLPNLGFSYIVHSDNMASNTSNSYTRNKNEMRMYLTAYGVEEPKITEIISEIFDFWKAVLNITDQFDEDLLKCQLKGHDSNFTEWDNFFDIAWWGKDFDLQVDDCPCEFFYIELDKVCQSHKRAVANYLAMKFLFEMDAKLMSPDFQRDYCVNIIRTTMPYLIDKLFLKAHFSNEIYEEVSTISNEVRKSLRSALTEADWLDESTRTEALHKESTMKTRIGSFEDNELTERLIREMDNLTFVEDNYYQNNINLHEFKTYMIRYNGLHSEIFDDTTKPLELLIAAQVNAFYYNIDNSINVMAGLLYPPAYHKAWPNSLKYGTLGYFIGIAYTHGFDSTGAYYDGNLEERYWWSNKSGTAFQERLDCYINHFNSYLIPEINRNVNGIQTIDASVADSGGLRAALNAYRNIMKEKTKEHGFVSKSEQMPGMYLSPEQLFFLGFAQIWCSSYDEADFWADLSLEHPMDKFRVLGAVTNYNEFANAYNCAEETKMNPKDKCRVW